MYRSTGINNIQLCFNRKTNNIGVSTAGPLAQGMLDFLGRKRGGPGAQGVLDPAKRQRAAALRCAILPDGKGRKKKKARKENRKIGEHLPLWEGKLDGLDRAPCGISISPLTGSVPLVGWQGPIGNTVIECGVPACGSVNDVCYRFVHSSTDRHQLP